MTSNVVLSVLVGLFIAVELTTASLTLFLPASEVRTLLGKTCQATWILVPFNENNPFTGLSRELFYVDEGIVRKNALDLVIPLAKNVDQLSFTWFSTDPKKVIDLKGQNSKLLCTCASF